MTIFTERELSDHCLFVSHQIGSLRNELITPWS